jgi:lipid-A-disaccharide synthase
MKRRIDHAAVILPFEAAFFRRHGIPATYVGHPLLDDESKLKADGGAGAAPRIEGDGPLVGLLPGSRQREVTQHLPAMAAAAAQLARRHPEIRFAVSVAPSVRRQTVEAILADRPMPKGALEVTDAPVETLFPACTLTVAVSGTVTLQAALAGTPTVIVYRVSSVSYWAGRALIRVPFIGLANLIAGRQVMPELIQKEADAGQIARTVERIVFSPAALDRMRRDLSLVRRRMGRPGASARVADIAVNMIRGG